MRQRHPLPTVVECTQQQLREWRARLLSDVRMTEDELAERAENYQLTAEELAVWNTLEGVRFLSGGPDAS